ncbi:MAG: sigma factor-like helix-turn-helix DNA-binding protein [Deltaproteobacteria bacterium]
MKIKHAWEFEEWISLYTLGILSGDELETFEAHIGGGCGVCREALWQTSQALSLIPRGLPDAPMPGGLLGGILGRIDASEGNMKKRPGFEKAFDLYANPLYEFALTLTGSESRAEQMVEAVFSDTAFEFAEDCDLFNRLMGAAIRIMKPAAERKSPLPRFRKDGHHKSSPVADWSQSAREGSLPRRIGDALEGLSPTERAAVILKDGKGMPDGDVARALGLSRGTLRRDLHTARLRMRGYIAASAENVF